MTEYNEPIDATGTLITGEAFSNVKELKRILVTNHDEDFYRTVTEKMLTYALGRGLEYYDVETVDQIVARIEKADGRASALLAGVVESAPFQKMPQAVHSDRRSSVRPVCRCQQFKHPMKTKSRPSRPAAVSTAAISCAAWGRASPCPPLPPCRRPVCWPLPPPAIWPPPPPALRCAPPSSIFPTARFPPPGGQQARERTFN